MNDHLKSQVFYQRYDAPGNRGPHNRGSSNQTPRKPVLPLDKKNFLKIAEENFKSVPDKGRPTTTKMRNILAMVSAIYNSIDRKSDKLNEDQLSEIQYLKLQVLYQSGRENSVKNFVRTTNIIEYIDRIGDSSENFLNFERYMEALVAYMKFFEK